MIPSLWRRRIRGLARLDGRQPLPRQARPAVELLEDRTTPATLNWTGAASTVWNSAGNWSPAQVPATNDILVFDSATPGLLNFTSNNNLAAGFTVGQIIINDTSPTSNFSVIGNAINLGLGLTHSSDATTSVGFTGITFNGPQTFANNLGQLNVTSPLNLLTHSLTVSGAGNTTLAGSISGAAASSNLNKAGAGTLTLSGNNTYNGFTSIGQGTVIATAANALGSVSGATSVGNGATLALSGGVALAAEQITVAGNGVGGGGAIRSLAGNNSMAATLRADIQAVPVLQNATALVSQGGFDVQTVIDGDFTNNNGWANNGGGASNIAVFETVNDLGTGEIQFTISMISQYAEHTVGKLRLSVTTDSRTTFADGLANGGDVIANWTELIPTFASSANGATLTINPDNSILASGTNPAIDVYTIRANLPLSGITGFRLEALTDPTLPNTGPGRPFNGNFVLTEMQVAFTGPPVPPSIAVDAGTLTLNGNLTTITGNNGTFAFTGAGNSVVNGAILGLGTSVVKSGAGNLTLNSNSNTYGGTTTISGGTLFANNTSGSATGTGAVTLQSGATLAGSGRIGGNLSAQLGSFVTPGGAGVDELTLAGTVDLGGDFTVQLNGPGPGEFDQLIVGQAGQNQVVNLSATLSGTLGFTLAVDERITIISNVGTGGVAGQLNGVADGGVITVGGQDLHIYYNAGDGNDVVLEGFINVPPSVSINTGLTVLEGGSAGITVAQLLVEDVQENAAQLTYTVTSGPTNGTLRKNGLPVTAPFTQADINGGLISYLHDGSETTSDSFGFEVFDGYDTIADTFDITVTPQNDAPTITDGTSIGVTMSEDAVPTAFSLTLNASDVDVPPQTLTWSISNDGGHGTASVDSPDTGNSMIISYVPEANYRGSDSFEVQVSDGAGGFDTITVNVTIEGVNDAPVASNTGNLSTPYLVPGTIDLRTLVSDLETLDNDLEFTVDNAVNGTVTLLADGYTAEFNATSQAATSFTFSVTDTGDGTTGAQRRQRAGQRHAPAAGAHAAGGQQRQLRHRREHPPDWQRHHRRGRRRHRYQQRHAGGQKGQWPLRRRQDHPPEVGHQAHRAEQRQFRLQPDDLREVQPAASRPDRHRFV